jgi:hypothetical protein
VLAGLLLTSIAMATVPGGLRFDSGLLGTEIRLRDAWALPQPAARGTHQALLDLQVPVTVARLPFALEAEIAALDHWDRGTRWRSPGQVRLAARLCGEVRDEEGGIVAGNSWGFELALPTRSDAPDAARALVTVESRPAIELLYVIEWTIRLGGSWLHLRGGAGAIRRLSDTERAWWPPAPMMDLGGAWVLPLGRTPLALGTELELLTDPVPIATRHWLRLTVGRHTSVDAGLHLPWVQLVTGAPELGVVGQLTWRR